MRKLGLFLTFFMIGQLVIQPAWAQTATLQRQFKLRQQTQTKSTTEQGTVSSFGKEVENAGATLGGQNLPVNPGDVALKQAIKVHVLGDVQTPGVYSGYVSQRLTDIIRFAGPNRASTRIVRIKNESGTKYYDLYQYYYHGNLKHNPFLRDGDVIFIGKPKKVVRIEGPVVRPGVYELSYEKNLKQVIRLAGGTTHAASDIAPIKVIRFSDAGQKFVETVENQKSKTGRFKVKTGDIVVIPDIVNGAQNFDYSVESIPGENLFYPTATPEVFVMGEVIQPGPFPYKSHLKIKDYVAYAAPSADAKLKSITVVRNGKRKRLKFHSDVQAGDILIVHTKAKAGTIIATTSAAVTLILSTFLLEREIRSR